MNEDSSQQQKERLGEVLVRTGIITPEQLKEALLVGRSDKKKIGQVLIEKKFLSPRDLATALSIQLQVPLIDLTKHKVLKDALKLVPEQSSETETTLATIGSGISELTVRRGTPRRSNEIAEFFNQVADNVINYTRRDIMEAFGEKAFLVLQEGDRIVGILGWQVENLIARTVDFLIKDTVPYEKAIPLLIHEMENASIELQCEISLLFVNPELAKMEQIWQQLGYEFRQPDDLKVVAWVSAARDSLINGDRLLFKKLRQDRVLRPI